MLKRIFTGIAAVIAIGSLAAIAGQFNGFPLVGGASYCGTTVNNSCVQTVPAGPASITGSERVPMDTMLSGGRSPQTVVASTSTLAAYGRSTQLLYTTTATAATAGGTTEQTLGTYSLPANTAIAGTKLKIKANWSLAANGNNKTAKIYFGTFAMSSGTLATNNKNATGEVIVTFKTGSTQIAYGNMLVDTTAITGGVNTALTEDGTAAIVIKFTCQDGTDSAGDCTLNDFSVERLGS